MNQITELCTLIVQIKNKSNFENPLMTQNCQKKIITKTIKHKCESSSKPDAVRKSSEFLLFRHPCTVFEGEVWTANFLLEEVNVLAELCDSVHRHIVLERDATDLSGEQQYNATRKHIMDNIGQCVMLYRIISFIAEYIYDYGEFIEKRPAQDCREEKVWW